MREHKIVVLKGDGIGPEIVDEALKVLGAAGVNVGFNMAGDELLMGCAAIDAPGVPLPVIEMSADYPEVELNHMYVNNCAMQLVRNPKQFDVIVTSNMFGDILSDEASMISGSIGMLASASLAEGKFGLYEPIHGSAPDIAGQGIANPLATILSAAMMLRYSLDEPQAAAAIENAVNTALETVRTPDIYEAGFRKVSTSEMGDTVVSLL